MHRKSLYIAAPLFSEAELIFNAKLAAELALRFDVYLPQRDGKLLVQMTAKGHCPKQTAKMIFSSDLAAIRASDNLLIVLDGRTVDEGAAFELGYAYAIGKPCYGLQTDPRRLLPTGNNPMIGQALIAVAESVHELIELMSE